MHPITTFTEFEGFYYVGDHFDTDGSGWVRLEDLLSLLSEDDDNNKKSKPLSDFKFLE